MSNSTLEPKWIFRSSGRRLRDDHLCGPNSRITPMIDIAVFFVVTVDLFVLTRRFLGAFLSGRVKRGNLEHAGNLEQGL